MKTLECPLNGRRNITEFVYGGEYQQRPNVKQASTQEWAEYVFFDDNPAGEVIEWWFHAPSAYWFLAKRNTLSDEVIATFDYKELEQHLETPVDD